MKREVKVFLKTFFILFLLFLLCNVAAKEDDEILKYAQVNIPKDLVKDVDEVYLLGEEEIVYQKDGTYTDHYHTVRKILTQKGLEDYSAKKLWLGYNYKTEELKIIKVQILNPDLKIITPNKEDIKQITDEEWGSKSYEIALPSLSIGSIIESEFEIKKKKPVMKNKYFGEEIFMPYYPFLKKNYTLKVPKDKNFKIIAKGKIKKILQSSEEKDYLVYKIQMENEKKYKFETGMPCLTELAPKIIYTNITSWDEIGIWWNKILQQKTKIDENITNTVNQIISPQDNEKEKVHKIYNFLVKNIRYVYRSLSDNGFEPNFASEVLKRKYGDCKDMVTLFLTMLKVVKINAFAALVNSQCGGIPKAEKELPILNFNHTIAMVPVNKKNYFLDLTCTYCPFEFINSEIQGKEILVTSETGAKFKKVPLLPPQKNYAQAIEKIVIDEKGNLQDVAKLKAGGGVDIYLRGMLKYYDKDDLDRYVKGFLNFAAPGAKLKKYELPDLVELSNPVEINLDFVDENNVDFSDPYPRFRMPGGEFIYFVGQQVFSLLGDEKRKYSFRFDRFFAPTFMFYHKAEVTFPKEYTLKLAKEVELDFNFGKLMVKHNLVENKLFYEAKFYISKMEITPEEFIKFREVIKKWMLEEKRQFFFIKK